MYLHKLPVGQRPGLGSLLSPCPSSTHGRYVLWRVPFLPMFQTPLRSSARALANPGCGLQQLLDYKNSGLLSRGAISLHSECNGETAPSRQPILSPYPQLQICKAQLGASLPGRQGYLGQERGSQGHFPQPHCWPWTSGTRISIDLEKDHIQVREVSAWAETKAVVGGQTPRLAHKHTQKMCTHVCRLSRNQ